MQTETPDQAQAQAQAQAIGQAEAPDQNRAVTPQSKDPVVGSTASDTLANYQRSCGNCHERGVVGAPKTGDVKAWAPRMQQGMDMLVRHVREGYKAMPPKGLCFDCSDQDYAELITYMASAH